MRPDDIARRIRDACLQAARQAHEDAGVQGLCAEGRWEAAMSALEVVDVQAILRELEHPAGKDRSCTGSGKAIAK